MQIPSRMAGSRDASAAAVAIQGDRIVITGTDGDKPELPRVLVLRLRANGAVDTSFAGDGELTVKTASGRCGIGNALARRDDGRIVVGHTVDTMCKIDDDDGDGGFEFGVLSLQRDGSPDRSFSGDGQFARELGDEILAGVADVAILPDGGIAAAGRVGGRLGILRLTAEGAPERGFGDRGGTILATGPVEPGGGMGGPARVLSRRGGGLLVIGHTALPGRRVYLAGVDRWGALDKRFAPTGVATLKLGISGVSDLALVDRGRAAIIAGFGVRSGHRGRLARVRLGS